MACLYARENSPFWYIRFKDARGKWTSKPTTYRWNNPQETKEAKARCAANTAQELSSRDISSNEKWDSWVDDFFATHCKNPLTRRGYDQSWQWLRSYLDEIYVAAPRQLPYQHTFDYIKWRTVRGGFKKKIKQSTALHKGHQGAPFAHVSCRENWLGIR